jgi:Divergent InlB B-repeat domain
MPPSWQVPHRGPSTDGADIGAFEAQKTCGTQATPSEACHTLTVSVAGSGAGTVSGTAIACPGTCSASFGASTTEALTATPAAGTTFVGWGGACSGTGACNVAMSADQTVAATFTPSTTTATTPPSISSLKHSASIWRAGSKLAQSSVNKKNRPPVGTTFSFGLNQAATVTLTFTHSVSGRKVAGRCVARYALTISATLPASAAPRGRSASRSSSSDIRVAPAPERHGAHSHRGWMTERDASVARLPVIRRRVVRARLGVRTGLPACRR